MDIKNDTQTADNTVIETVEQAAAAIETAPATETPADAAAVTAPAAVDDRVYVVIGEFTPKRGFETVLLAQLVSGPQTAAQATAALLESGEYTRVAPRAAELRPGRPVATCLKQWLEAGFLGIAEEGAAAYPVTAVTADPVAETDAIGESDQEPADETVSA